MVKIELGKKDFVWIGLLIVLVGVGFVYGYGGSSPSVFGHTGGEIIIDDVFCARVTGHGCGYDNVGGGVTTTPTTPTAPVVIPIDHYDCNGAELWWFASDGTPTQLVDKCSAGMCYEAKCSECDYSAYTPRHYSYWQQEIGAPASSVWVRWDNSDVANTDDVTGDEVEKNGFLYHKGVEAKRNDFAIVWEVCRQKI